MTKTILAAVAAVALVGCGGGPGSGATFDEDAPGAEASEPTAAEDGEAPSRPTVRGRDDGSTAEEADLAEYAQRACDRAVTGSGRYSQSGYDRGVSEGVDAGLDEGDMVAAIEEACGERISEARGE